MKQLTTLCVTKSMNNKTNQTIVQLVRQLNLYRSELLILLLFIFYTVGTVGILLPETREQFLSLSFFNLILSFSILLLGRKEHSLQTYVFIVCCFMTGMTVEWIGIHTGWLFGNYYYGENLGFKWLGVPLVIGINWSMLVFTSGSFFAQTSWKPWLKALASAGLMTGLDVLMEPVAMKSDFWHWSNNTIPIFNYTCWFFISWALLWIGFYFNRIETNKVSKALFILLAVFFTLLNC